MNHFSLSHANIPNCQMTAFKGRPLPESGNAWRILYFYISFLIMSLLNSHMCTVCINLTRSDGPVLHGKLMVVDRSRVKILLWPDQVLQFSISSPSFSCSRPPLEALSAMFTEHSIEILHLEPTCRLPYIHGLCSSLVCTWRPLVEKFCILLWQVRVARGIEI
jgi:hypothetical protein